MVKTPTFKVRREKSDLSTHVRISRIENGFVVKTGESPIHYATIDEVADAISAGLKALKWPENESKSSSS